MNLANQISVFRILLVPVFVILAFRYEDSFEAGNPDPWLRWSAVAVFVIAALSDAIDGWVARRFNQRSQLGAFLDPLADKLLMGHAVLVGTLVDWGSPGWHLPMWFAIVVWSRDALMIIGLLVVKCSKQHINFKPHFSGKYATAAQMITLAWITLGVFKIDPVWPCAVATFFTAWSAFAYFSQAKSLLNKDQ